MPSNLPPESPKHHIEFTGNSAPKKRRKPPPTWIVGWFGGLLLFVGGVAVGGFVVVALIWMLFTITDDVGSPLMAILFLLLGAMIGAVVGSIAGLLVWAKLRTVARELEELDWCNKNRRVPFGNTAVLFSIQLTSSSGRQTSL